MDAALKKIILDLLTKRIDNDTFLKRYPDAGSETGVEMLEHSFTTHDPDEVEFGLALAYSFGAASRCGDLCRRLAFEDWHMRHEAIASSMGQELRDPANVPALLHMASQRYPYLAFDEFETLPGKCLISLFQIGTPEAVQAIRALSESSNPVIKQKAIERLQKWEKK
jgi:hypothetical protein